MGALIDAPRYLSMGVNRRLGGLHKTNHRKLRDVNNIAVSEVPAHSQHGTNTLQKEIAAFNRQRSRRVHDGGKLAVGEENHGPDDARWRQEPPGVNRAAA